MKKALKIIGIILLVIIVIIGGLAIWQRKNIMSIITSTQYSKEELTEKINENKKDIEQIVETYSGGVVLEGFNHEEEEKIRRGEITPEEAVEKIISRLDTTVLNKGTDNPGEQNSPANNGTANAEPGANGTPETNNSGNSENAGGSENSGGSNTTLNNEQNNNNSNENTDVFDNALKPTAEDDASVAINKYVAQMYVLQAQFIGRLGDLERRAVADYTALPKEKRGVSGQQSIISKYLGEAAALESDCDAKVSELLNSLQKTLEASGGDVSLVSSLRNAYEDEKLLKKSYYINSYK